MADKISTGMTVPSIRESYVYCSRLAKTHYENFIVSSFLIPRRLNPYIQATYAFCRYTDDLGDEADGNRLELLDEWEEELFRAYAGQPTHPIMVALQDVINTFSIPHDPFWKIIQANRMDQHHHGFESFRDLLHYCQHSANPVGHIVLSILNAVTAENMRFCDATCTALQLTNFLQDIRHDYLKERIYIPSDDMKLFGVEPWELGLDIASSSLRSLVRFETDRALELFQTGQRLLDQFHGRFKLYVALLSKGGMCVLDSIRAQDYDVLFKRPTVSKSRKALFSISVATRLGLRRTI